MCDHNGTATGVSRMDHKRKVLVSVVQCERCEEVVGSKQEMVYEVKPK